MSRGLGDTMSETILIASGWQPARYDEASQTSLPRKLSIFAFVAVLHIVVIALLIRGFAAVGEIAPQTALTQAYSLPLAPSPRPEPPLVSDSEEAAGKAAPVAARAKPKEIVAPKSPALQKSAAPPTASEGAVNRSGAGDSGTGSGGGGLGDGTGSGGSGSGQVAGGARKVEKISGDIRSARDYPKAGREDRLGRRVVIAITVGADGSPKACRVARPSGNDEADRITCQLAMERFRFRPATDRNGNPVEAVYGWEQRWFAP